MMTLVTSFSSIMFLSFALLSLQLLLSFVDNTNYHPNKIFFVTAQNLVVDPADSYTVLQDTTRTGIFTVSGELCEYCTLQLGPNLNLSSSPEIILSLVLGRGSNVTFSGVNFQVASDNEESAGLRLRLELNSSSVCGEPSNTNLDQRPSIFIQNSVILAQTTAASNYAVSILFQPLLHTDPSHEKCAGARIAEIPHLLVAVSNNSKLIATATGTTVLAAYNIVTSSQARQIGNFVTLVDLQVEHSYLEATISRSQADGNGYAANIFVSDIGLSSVLFKHNQLTVESKMGDSRAMNVVLGPVNQKFVDSSDEVASSDFSKFTNYEVDLVFAFNEFYVRTDSGSCRSFNILIKFYSRFWLLHSKIESSKKDTTDGDGLRIESLGYETNKSIEELGWMNDRSLLGECFGEGEVEHAASNNMNLLSGILVYELDCTLINAASSEAITLDDIFWSRNQTFINIYTFHKNENGHDTSATTIEFKYIQAADVISIRNMYSLYEEFESHSMIETDGNPLYTNYFLATNITMVRLNDPSITSGTESNTIGLLCNWSDTVIILDGVYHLVHEDMDPSRKELSLSNVALSLVNVNSLTMKNIYSNGISSNLASGPTLTILEGTVFENEIILENVTSLTGASAFSTGVGFLAGKPGTNGYGTAQTAIYLGFDDYESAEFKNITIRNCHFDLYKNIPNDEGTVLTVDIGLAQVHIASLTIIDSYFGPKADFIRVMSSSTATIGRLSLLNPCSTFAIAPNGNHFTSLTELEADLSTSGLQSLPSDIILEPCSSSLINNTLGITRSQSNFAPLAESS